jgi:hypothetical protein
MVLAMKGTLPPTCRSAVSASAKMPVKSRQSVNGAGRSAFRARVNRHQPGPGRRAVRQTHCRNEHNDRADGLLRLHRAEFRSLHQRWMPQPLLSLVPHRFSRQRRRREAGLPGSLGQKRLPSHDGRETLSRPRVPISLIRAKLRSRQLYKFKHLCLPRSFVTSRMQHHGGTTYCFCG